MMKAKNIAILLMVMLVLLCGCNSKEEKIVTDGQNETVGQISVDKPDAGNNGQAAANEPKAQNDMQAAADKPDAEYDGQAIEIKSDSRKVRIALIDSGVSAGNFAAENIAEGYNYIENSADTKDTFNHGTESAAIILQYDPDAVIVPLVCTKYNSGRVESVDSDTLAQMILDAVYKYDCDIICAEVGITKPTEALKAAVDEAAAAGRLILAPVGNSNEDAPERVYYPAAYVSVLGVGALNDTQDMAADYSQRGEAVSILAPGTAETILMSGTKHVESGTSVAVACTAGAASNILHKCSELDVSELFSLLCETADDIGNPGYDTDTGHGALNAEKAAEAAGN